MEQESIRVLLVEDDTVDQMAFARFVRREGLHYDYQTAGSVAKAKSLLAAESFDIIIADYMLGDGNLLDLLADFRGVPFIVVTGTGDERTAVRAMREGAGDYLIKDAAGSYLLMLPSTVEHVLERQRAKDALRNYQQYLEQIVRDRTAALEAEIERRKQAQVERERLIEELETRNAELERFVYTVSHDLKTPLLSISWFIGAIKEDMASGKLEEAAGNADRVRDAVETMTHLLNDVLNLARTGRVIGTREDVSLTQLVREARALLENRIVEQNARIEIVSDETILNGDRTRLRELMLNLIENGLKFTRGESSPRVEVGVRRDGDESVYFVRDNGIGVETQYRERIFGLFDQLDPGVEGSGVGLALARRIVEVHGGRIWCESEGPGRGATFCFTLPTTGPSGELDNE